MSSPSASGSVLYLAYGSNLHPGRLFERVPSARFVALVELRGRRLAFHKRGQDGSGKCLFYPGRPQDVLFGAVFQLAAEHKAGLDRAEGVGRGYVELRLRLPESAGTRAGATAYVYAAQDPYVDPTLKPFLWYKKLVLAGARYHRLPPSYLAAIEAVPADPDPNAARARRHARLLRALGAG